jgi:hypothetical protein
MSFHPRCDYGVRVARLVHAVTHGSRRAWGHAVAVRFVAASMVVGGDLGCALDEGRKRESPDGSVSEREHGGQLSCQFNSCVSGWLPCLRQAERLGRACYERCTADCGSECTIEVKRAVAACKTQHPECISAEER